MVQETGKKGNFQGNISGGDNYCSVCDAEIPEETCYYCGRDVCPQCMEKRVIGFSKYGSELYHGPFCDDCLIKPGLKTLLAKIQDTRKPEFDGNIDHVSMDTWRNAVEQGIA